MKSATHSSAVQSTSKAEIIKQIQALVPPGSPEPQDPEILATLRELTAQLIEAYKADGLLGAEPFEDVRNRSIHLYASAVSSKLQGKTVLVTGGEGCVGTYLIEKLIALGTKQIISVDKARCNNPEETTPSSYQEGIVKFYAADIRNGEALQSIFETERPEIVFHLAAQRLPGLAEIKIHETITTSLLGTKHIIQLCEAYKVQQCIFSSTGKASRYYTAEVYAASKKLAEWQFAKAAQEGKVTYGMVRFTHMLENSSFCEQMTNKVQQGKTVNVHAPHRYVTAQNVEEATHLLLNSLVLSVPGKLKFLTVRNLGWPTETLAVALYKIMESGKNLPIYFQGLLPGYEEPFFLGQFDWSNPTEIHLLINVLEDPFRMIDESGDMVIAELAPFSVSTVTQQVAYLEALIADSDFPEAQLKPALAKSEKAIITSIFSMAPASQLLKILEWGLNPQKLQADGTNIASLSEILELLLQGLHGRLDGEVLEATRVSLDRLDDLIATLSHVDTIAPEVGYLQTVSRYVREFESTGHLVSEFSNTVRVDSAVGANEIGSVKCA